MQGNAVGEWDLGGVLDDMFAACWGGRSAAAQPAPVRSGGGQPFACFQCVLHVCVRVRSEPVSRRCLVAELWWGGFSRGAARRGSGFSLWRVA